MTLSVAFTLIATHSPCRGDVLSRSSARCPDGGMFGACCGRAASVMVSAAAAMRIPAKVRMRGSLRISDQPLAGSERFTVYGLETRLVANRVELFPAEPIRDPHIPGLHPFDEGKR